MENMVTGNRKEKDETESFPGSRDSQSVSVADSFCRGSRTGYKEPVCFQSKRTELVYDGNGELDLLEGVTASDEDGTDLTGEVSAVITGEGSGSEKQIRYTVFSPSGEEATAQRTLVLKDYDGPKITVPSRLELDAEDLNNLIENLKRQGKIKGENGFGVDITDQITWKREKISSGIYQLTGEIKDLTLTLVQNRIEILQGVEFSPWDYLQEAQDPDFGSVADRVQISNMVNVYVPGTYSVVYSVTSVDGTQSAEAVLSVTVTEGDRG